MTTISAADAKQNFDALLEQVQRGPVCIRQDEREVAVVISREEFDVFRKLRADELIAISEQAGRYAESQGMTDEVLARLLAEE